MFCPRGIYSWWREVWLERVEETGKSDATRICKAASILKSDRKALESVQGAE
jgi:hypothetical protein